MGNPQSAPQNDAVIVHGPPDDAVREGDVWNFFGTKDYLCDAVKSAHGLPESMKYYRLPVAELKELIGKFRPVHRVRLEVFRKVLQSGSLQSRHLRETIDSDPAGVLVQQIRSDVCVRALTVRYLHLEHGSKFIFDWLSAWATLELFTKLGKPNHELELLKEELQAKENTMNTRHGWSGFVHGSKQVLMTIATHILPQHLILFIQDLLEAGDIVPGGTTLVLQHRNWDSAEGVAEFRRAVGSAQVNDEDREWLQQLDKHVAEYTTKALCVSDLKKELLKRARSHVDNIASNITTGIGFHVDKQIGTDRHVFCIIGPHFGTCYGEICIVLSQKIMYDPDFDMSPCAGTGFCSGNAKRLNRWLAHGEYELLRGADQFHLARLNAGVLGWRSVMAAAIGSAVAAKMNKSLDAVTEGDLRQFLATSDSHLAIEGHLPSIVPLDYVERVVMPESTYDKLSDDEKADVQRLFGNKVFRVKSTGDPATIMSHCFEEIVPQVSKGFCMHIPEGRSRELRGVRPCRRGVMTLSVRLRGSVQLVLSDPGHAPNGIALVIGYGMMADFDEEQCEPREQDELAEHSEPPEHCEPSEHGEPAEQGVSCWVTCVAKGVSERFDLPVIEDLFDLKVQLIGDQLLLQAAGEDKTVTSWPQAPFRFAPSSISVQTGRVPADVEDLKVM